MIEKMLDTVMLDTRYWILDTAILDTVRDWMLTFEILKNILR